MTVSSMATARLTRIGNDKQNLPAPIQRRKRSCQHVGKGLALAAVNRCDGGDGIAGRKPLAQTGSYDQVTDPHVCLARHRRKAQVFRGTHTKCHRSQASAIKLHRQCVIRVGDQSHLGKMQVHILDLTHHSGTVDYGLPGSDSLVDSPVNDDSVRKRVEIDLGQLGELKNEALPGCAVNEGPQPGIFPAHRLQAFECAFLRQQLLPQLLVFAAQPLCALEETKHFAQAVHGPVDYMINRLDQMTGQAAEVRYVLPPVVHRHQHDGQQSVEHQAGGQGSLL